MTQHAQLEVIDNRSEARAYIYKWMQEKFVTPEGEKYSPFDMTTLREALEYVGIQSLEEYLVEMEETLNNNYDEKQAVLEYCKLFYGPNKIPCPPFGSYYVDTTIPMNQSAVLAMDEYLKWDLVLGQKSKQFPDHIAIELEFIYFLAVKEEEARENGDYAKAIELIEAQQKFISTHFFRWLPSFVEKTTETTDMKLISGLVKFVNEFIKEDYKLLKDIKKQYENTFVN